MKIALCGAHRSGKTTLAKAFADRHGIKYLDMSTRSVISSLGLDVSVPLSPDDRKRLQNRLLAKYAELYRTPGSWVADRSPLDLVAYSLMEYPGDDWVDTYSHDCLRILSYLTHLVYVPSTIPVVEDRNKPTASLSSDVRLKNDLLIRGAISRFVEERDLSLDLVYMRLNSNMNSVEQRVKQMSIMLQQFSS